MTNLESLFGSMTISDLARFAGTTVAHVVEVALGQTPASSTKAPTATKARPKAKLPKGSLSTDTVLAALRAAGANAKLQDVREKTGGSEEQVRAALKKLASAKKIVITGARRGTRYTAK